MEYSASEIFDIGVACLIDNLGIVNAEHFIAEVKRQKFDYTVWQREHFDKMEPGQFHKELMEYAKTHPDNDNNTKR